MRHLAGIAGFIVAILISPASAQSDPAYQHWLHEDPARLVEAKAFEAFLAERGVGGVLPTDQLLRNATSWRACKLEWPWSMPPRELWPHVVPTLRFIRDEIAPRIGPVAVESGYREPKLNRCAGGAAHSAHALFYALDLMPQRAVSQKVLIATICNVHREAGRNHNVGLGFYGGVRFHVDTKGFRRWGSDNHSGTSPCARAGS